jgi:hypothetical protein
MCKIISFIFICLGCKFICIADANILTTNVAMKCFSVFQDYYLQRSKIDPEDRFRAVRGGGVDFELDGIHLERFMDLVKVVSNNCSQIASDWYSYETNEMVRFTTLSAVGYSGYNNYTNFVDKLLAFTETDTRTNYWRSLRFIMLPYGTKQETKLALTYEDVVVSNIFVRIRQQAINNVDTNSVNFCNRVLSGEWKREHLQMEAAGAL